MTASPALDPASITGLVLAGGQGRRMGGIDKGLALLQGRPLAGHVLQRLKPQVGPLLISANRHLDRYAAWGVPVCPDAQTGHPGPLAGFLAGLAHCQTPWLLTVPCDTPCFPHDLAQRLAAAALDRGAAIAVACAPEGPGAPGEAPALRLQPAFCLLRRELKDSLAQALARGERKIQAWLGQHTAVRVPFDRPADDPLAFFNANTPQDLQVLARLCGGPAAAEDPVPAGAASAP
ncbi:molybdenum cofactor guanylyltransferase MobA [Xenophilus sp. Marseille-Q4582]|uniref:molybdenum cofactor guanylyltransferase MobA n=1 Tax=Xenophilus sp. Marseille-Q4582 TaxID=2866600 RepID=UPI001CE47612|nr:molybdenum cofactor guanylyltransferase MobA [Xenophilus sp. Marseille-Q4582]